MKEWLKIFKQDIPYLTKDILMQKISNFNTLNDNELFDALKTVAPLYFLRKMQLPNFEEFRNMSIILEKLKEKFNNISTLDYGCGSADLSIYLAKMGCNVTICDVEHGNLDAAIKRFELRNLNMNAIPATYNNSVPDIRERFHLIIALEVIEHIRDPFKLIYLIDRIIEKDGIIYLGSFPFNSTTAVGDHLEEAVSQRLELLKWIETHWERVAYEGIEGNFFSKKID